ncbi:hypothetical protein BDZ97DRAFT_1923631 [Flammula alnicola]|nr:hypothetical protein BDZ97DRAFT_1923631 [Flammula alnicola]
MSSLTPDPKSQKTMLESLSDYDHMNVQFLPDNPAMHRKLANLVEKRRALKTQVNHHHNPLIHGLPSEIASHIFTLYVESINDYFLSDNPYDKAHWSPPLLLAAFCKTWREIAFATPRLWACVNILLSDFDYLGLQAELVKQWLDRSGELPLSINLFTDFPKRGQVKFPEYCLPSLDVLRQYVHRWRSLTLFSDMHYNRYLIGDLKRAPMLKTLRLKPVLYCNASFSLLETPSLRQLEINYSVSISNVYVQWDILTFFESYRSLADDVLCSAKRLVTGRFHHVDQTSIEEFIHEPPTRVIHTSLKICILAPRKTSMLHIYPN